MKLLKLFKRNFLKIALIVVMSGITTAVTYAQVADIKPFWGGAAEQIYNKHGALVIMDTIAPGLVNPIPTSIPVKLFVDSALTSAFSDVTSLGKIHVMGCTSNNDGRLTFGNIGPSVDSDACAKVHGEVLATNFLPTAGDTTPNRNLCADVNGVVGPCPAGASYSCTGTTPANSQLCFRDNLDLTQDTPKTLAWFCMDTAKCEYKCNSGYYYDLTTQVCTLIPPIVNNGNGVACLSDDVYIPMCTNGTLVPGSQSGTASGSTVTSSWQCAGNDSNGNPTVINCSGSGIFNIDYNISFLNT